MVPTIERALQSARQVGADRELVAPGLAQVVHRVEARHLVYRHGRHAQIFRDERHHRRRQAALLVLRGDEHAHHRRALLLGRVLRDLAIDLFQGLCAQHFYRSTSPKTMSWVPMMATASASMWPRAISSSADRCANPAARILRR